MTAAQRLAVLISLGLLSSLSCFSTEVQSREGQTREQHTREQHTREQHAGDELIREDHSANSRKKILVIAHRGASGYRPEHTLQAYELAIDLGADFVEPDLVPTKDGELVARHENNITGTTDVANHPEFASRKTKKTIDGQVEEGWFVEDFTLAELKTLRAKERMPQFRQHNTLYDNLYQIPTFQEIIDLVKWKEKAQKRRIGIYPEAKHPSYFSSIGLANDERIIELLSKNGYSKKTDPIFIQCFEPSTLKKLRAKTKLHLIQLIEEDGQPYDWTLNKDTRQSKDMVSEVGLKEIARYADGIGPSKNLIVPRDVEGNLLQATKLVERAHKYGLAVHPWTFRNENNFLPKDLRNGDINAADFKSYYGNALEEYKRFYELGIDGVFSESPDTAIEARRMFSETP